MEKETISTTKPHYTCLIEFLKTPQRTKITLFINNCRKSTTDLIQKDSSKIQANILRLF